MVKEESHDPRSRPAEWSAHSIGLSVLARDDDFVEAVSAEITWTEEVIGQCTLVEASILSIEAQAHCLNDTSSNAEVGSSGTLVDRSLQCACLRCRLDNNPVHSRIASGAASSVNHVHVPDNNVTH